MHVRNPRRVDRDDDDPAGSARDCHGVGMLISAIATVPVDGCLLSPQDPEVGPFVLQQTGLRRAGGRSDSYGKVCDEAGRRAV